MTIHHEDGSAGDVQSVARGQMPHFLLDTKEIPEDSVLLIVPEDQTDPTVKEYLGNGIQTPLMQKGRCYFGLDRHGTNVLVTDALGAPIADAVVEFRLIGPSQQKASPVRYGSWRTNAEGLVELPEVGAFLLVDETFVSQPAYGVASIKDSKHKDRLDTPLVAQRTEGWERALRGRVVDAEDRPVEAAVVSVDSVTASGGVSTPLYPPAAVLTDAKGCFALLAGNSRLPAHSVYRYKVAPPTSASCVPYGGEANNDAETVIRLERGTFHTFAFKDASGRIMDENRLYCITSTRKDTRFQLDSDGVRSGAVLANGTYSATMWSFTAEKVSADHGSDVKNSVSEPVTFPDIEVTGSSPRELVFSLSGMRDHVFRGVVLNARTQEPLEGVLVSTGGLPPKALRPDEQEWLGPLVSDANSSTVQDSAFVRTGKDGCFELALMPGQKIDRLALWARNFLPYKYRCQNRTPDAADFLHLEEIPMFPAGMLSFQVSSESTDEQYIATWKFEEPAPSLCALALWDKLLSELMSPPAYLLDDNLHRVNRLEHVYLPAEAIMWVELRSFPQTSRRFVLPRRFTLSPGEAVNLEPFTLQSPIDVPVQVVDEHGIPFEAMPVRSTIGMFTEAPVYTDAKGMAVISLPPDSSGSLSISKEPRGGTEPVVVTCPFSLHGKVPEKNPYVLVLPIEDAPQVFGDMTNTNSLQQPRLQLRRLNQLSLTAGDLDDGA